MATSVKTKFSYGVTLKNRRNLLRYSVDEMAKIAGITGMSIYNIENGKPVAYWLIKKYIIALGGTLEINFPDIPSYKEQKKIDKKKEEKNSDFDYTL